MSDITGRGSLEKRLAALMAELLESQQMRLLELLGDPPNPANLPFDFWQKEGERFAEALRPFFREVFLNRAEQTLAASPIGVDWALVNEQAVTFARDYSFELVRGLNETSQKLLQQAVGNFFEESMTIGELEATLTRAFGPVRSEMIAVTEVTRAAAEGERSLAAEVASQGVEMRPIHQTNADALVCPICGPRHGKEIPAGEAWPPLHPRCRCWVTHEMRELNA